jgi:cobyrinic acid a,c-diamide synthase
MQAAMVGTFGALAWGLAALPSPGLRFAGVLANRVANPKRHSAMLASRACANQRNGWAR